MTPSVQLYARQQGATGPDYSQYTLIDTYESEPIKLTKSIQGLEDPEVTTSGYSQTFRVPSTSSNGQYFKAVFNVNSVDYDATIKADAYINVDGAYFTSGNIRLTNIYRNDRTGKIEYEIVFMGETSNFGSVVSPKDLSALNLNQYTHNLTYTNVVNSWTGSLFSGDIVYPLAEYGYTYDDNGQPEQSTLSVYNGTTSLKGFTNSSNGLSPQQFKPAIRAKKVWDQIFTEAGFTYTSDFLGGIGSTADNLFSNLYMLSSNTALPEFSVDGAFEVGVDTFPALLSSSSQIISLDLRVSTVSVDSSNSVSVNPDNYYEAPISGQPYTFSLDNLVISGRHKRSADLAAFVMLELYKNGSLISQQAAYSYKSLSGQNLVGGPLTWDSSLTGYGPGGAYSQLTNPANAAKLKFDFVASANADDRFSFKIKCYGSEWDRFQIFDGVWLGDSPNQVTPAGLLPAQYKQIDFIKGITQKFKLVWEPDPENAKNFYIEPWNDWILGGEQRDWTGKLNQQKDKKITPLFQTQQREIFFKDAKEGDLYNVLFENQNKEIFGELKQDSNIELITGVKNIQTFFAPTPLAPIPGDNGFIIPHFAKDTETERQPIQIKPRLLFYNGLHNPGSSIWYINNDSGTGIPKNAYPLVSNFSSYPFNNNSFDLNWNNPAQYFNFDETGFSGRTNLTAFNQYWKKWYDFTYSPYSRVMEANFLLSSTDIQELRFNDKIFVQDSWWLVQEIKEYTLGGLQDCRVKLLKLADNVDFALFEAEVDENYYRIDGLCYSGRYETGSACEACCCQGQTGVVVYGNGKTLAQSITLYQDAGGILYAPSGFYSDGTDAYEVGTNGVIFSVSLCSGCSCTPTGLTGATVNNGSQLCTVCCDGIFPDTIYHNGTSTLTSATRAYATPTGGALTPFQWYRESGSTEAVRLAGNGIDIDIMNLCTTCICTQLPAEYVSATEVYQGASGATAAVCCTDIASPSSTIYATDTSFAAATGYYYDPYGTLPVGAFDVAPVLLSGVGATGQFVQVEEGAPTAYGFCPGGTAADTLCGRDQAIDLVFYVTPSGPTADVSFTVKFQNPTTVLYETKEVINLSGSGSGLVDSQESFFRQDTNFKVEWNFPAVYGGDITFLAYDNTGTLVYTTTGFTGETPAFGPVGISPSGGGFGTQWVLGVVWTP